MIKLISPAFLKAECEISKEVDASELDNPIKQAQDRLNFLIGRQLYDEIYTQVTTSTLSTTNSAFFDPYVKQFLAWQAHEFYQIKSTAVSKRTGLRVFKDDTDDPAPESILNIHIKYAKEQTEFYKGQMINYLIQEATSFPLYDADCENRKMGTGFGITGVAKISTSQSDIAKKIYNNGD